MKDDTVEQSNREILEIRDIFQAARDAAKSPKNQEAKKVSKIQLEEAMKNYPKSTYEDTIQTSGAFLTFHDKGPASKEPYMSVCSCGNTWYSDVVPDTCSKCGSKNLSGIGFCETDIDRTKKKDAIYAEVLRLEKANIPGDFTLLRTYHVRIKKSGSPTNSFEITETSRIFFDRKQFFSL